MLISCWWMLYLDVNGQTQCHWNNHWWILNANKQVALIRVMPSNHIWRDNHSAQWTLLIHDSFIKTNMVIPFWPLSLANKCGTGYICCGLNASYESSNRTSDWIASSDTTSFNWDYPVGCLPPQMTLPKIPKLGHKNQFSKAASDWDMGA